MPRRGPGRLEPFLAVSLALHALVALLVPRWWELPRIRLSMAQGGVVQVLAVPLPPQPAAEPASAGGEAGRAQTAVRNPGARQTAPVRAVAQRPRPAPQPAQEKPPASGQPGLDPRPAASAPAASRPEEARLTSQRSPVTVAASSARPSEKGAPTDVGSAQAGSAGTGAQGGSEGQASGGTEQAGSEPAAPAPVPAASVLPGGGLRSPSYPKDAVSRGLEGRVVLRLTVGPDGSVQQAEVLESSGWRDFDAVASQFARRLTFRPVTAGRGYRLAMEFVFTLHRDAQNRVEPSVEVRPLGNLEFLPPQQAASSA